MNRWARSTDVSFSFWPVALCTQVVQAASLVSACIFYVRPFLDSTDSGMLGFESLRKQSVEGSGSIGNSSDSRKNSASTGQKSKSKLNESSSVHIHPQDKAKNVAVIYAGDPGSEDGHDVPVGANVIRRTVSFAVSREPRGPITNDKESHLGVEIN